MITKTCLGFSTTVAVVCSIAEVEVLSRTVASLRTLLLLNLIVGVSGVIVFFCARLPNASQRKTSPESRAMEKLDSDCHPLHFLREWTYWGAIVALVSFISCVAIVCSFLMKPKVNATARSAAPPPSAPVKFPPMRIQGIVVRGLQSSVMIDGKIYFLGDYIGDVRVVAIDEESATLELAGQTNVLVLPK